MNSDGIVSAFRNLINSEEFRRARKIVLGLLALAVLAVCFFTALKPGREKTDPFFDTGMNIREVRDTFGKDFSLFQMPENNKALIRYEDIRYNKVRFDQLSITTDMQGMIESMSFTRSPDEALREETDRLVRDWAAFLSERRGEPKKYDGSGAMYVWDNVLLRYSNDETGISITLMQLEPIHDGE